MADFFRLSTPTSLVTLLGDDALTGTGTGTLSGMGLDDLANNGVALSVVFDNVNGDIYADFLAALAYVSGITIGTVVADLYLLPEIDGVHYVSRDSTAMLPSESMYVCSFESRAGGVANTLEYCGFVGARLVPGRQRFALVNKSGVAYSDSSIGAFLKMRPYQFESP